MSCEHVHELISGLLDRRLDAETRGVVLGHLAECRPCQDRFTAYQRMSASLRALNEIPVPPRLAAQLQIAASKDRSRRVARRTAGGWVGQWLSWARLGMDNMMRPLALPFAGGVFSALVLFSSLMPTLAFHKDFRNDVPISLFTDPALEEIGHSHVSTDDTVLHLTIDDRGRVSDVVSSQGKLTPEMENDLLFYRFAPATAFGQPTWGKATVTFRRLSTGSHIVVRG
jgi:hypothetical protein